MLADAPAPIEPAREAKARKPLFAPGFFKRNGSRVALVLAYYIVAIPAGMFRAGADNFGFPVRSRFTAIENVILNDWPNRALQVDWLQPIFLQHTAAMIYLSWFALPITATLPLFNRVDGQPWRLVGFVMIAYYLGMPFFALYPLEPPWAHNPEHVMRVFQVLHPEIEGKDANPFASMPSLHVALPAAASLWWGWKSTWGKVMLGYACLIWLTVIYSGDHYVADGLAGFALATATYWIVRWARLPLLRSEPAPAESVEPVEALPRAA